MTARSAPDEPAPVGDSRDPGSRRAARRRRAHTVWAGAWAAVLVLLFAGVTALTLGLWLTDPGYDETNPVGDLAFLVLGTVIGLGFGSQARSPGQNVAGRLQALVGILALGLAGLVGDRVEPLVGGLVLAGAWAVLLVLRPARPERAAARAPRRPDAVVVGLAVLGAVAAVPYAVVVVGLARDAGPSCFYGRCARGDRLAELAAAAVTVALVGAVAGRGAPGWRLPLWCAGLGALVIGSASLVLPGATGSLGVIGGALAVAWGVILVVAGERHARPPRPSVSPV